MKHLEFLAKISLGSAFFAFPLTASAQYSEMANRDNPQAQQRALMTRIDQQESRIHTLEKEVYALRLQVQSQAAASGAPAPAQLPAGASETRGPRSMAGMHTYEVREGDTLHNIALRNGLSVNDLMTLNGLQSPTIFMGSEIVVPGPANKATAPKSGSVAAPATQTASGKYTVKSGDTVASIAARNRVTIQDILAVNRLTDPNRLAIGQELLLPAPGAATAAAAASPAQAAPQAKAAAKTPSADNPFPSGYAYYTVSPGDSLYSIARTFGTTEKRLEELNEMALGATIHPDDQLLVPMDKYKGPIAETASTN